MREMIAWSATTRSPAFPEPPSGLSCPADMAREENTIRFAVGTADGPRSSIWRVWVESDGSIYVGERYTAGRLKASLHPSGSWRIAFTDSSEAQRLMGGADDTDRAFDKFGPSREMALGVRRAFTVVIPWLSVTQPRHGKVTEGEVHWLPALPVNHLEEVIVFLTDSAATARIATWPGASNMGAKFLGRLGIQNGSTVWVVSWRRAALPEEIAKWTKAQVELSQKEEARKGARPDADMRADLIGTRNDDDSRFFVDLLLVHPMQGGNPQ